MNYTLFGNCFCIQAPDKRLKSYLSGRSQVIQVNRAQSSIRYLEKGMPQGSSCSCTVFAMFVGDIGQWINEGFIVAYADDTFITLEADSLEDLKNKLEKEGERVLSFFTSNALVANPSKSALLIFRPTNANISNHNESISLRGDVIMESREERMLGIIVQNNLKFASQVEKVKKSTSHSLFRLRRLQHVLGPVHLKQLQKVQFNPK